MTDFKPVQKLHFLYNADSGKMAAFVDSAKKLLSINGCTLCSITHGMAGEKSDWQTCRDELGVPIEYVHRDEIKNGMRDVIGTELPAVVAEVEHGYELLLDAKALERCKGSVADLRGRLEARAAMKELTLR